MQAPIDDFKRPGQNVALVQFAHADLDCVSQNGRAAFRLLGLFDTNDDAVTWFRRNDQRRFYDGLPATIVPTFEDVVIPSTTTRTVEELAAKRDAVVRAHQDARAQQKEAFEARVQAIKDGTAKPRAPPQEAPPSDTQKKAGSAIGDLFDPVPRDAEVRGQAFMVCSCLVDPTPDQEDVITVYAAFDHVNAAQDYVSTLKELVDERSLYVVNMYEWAYPYLTTTDGFKSKVPRRYHEPLLNDILVDGKIKRATALQKVKAQGGTPHIIDVSQ